MHTTVSNGPSRANSRRRLRCIVRPMSLDRVTARRSIWTEIDSGEARPGAAGLEPGADWPFRAFLTLLLRGLGHDVRAQEPSFDEVRLSVCAGACLQLPELSVMPWSSSGNSASGAARKLLDLPHDTLGIVDPTSPASATRMARRFGFGSDRLALCGSPSKAVAFSPQGEPSASSECQRARRRLASRKPPLPKRPADRGSRSLHFRAHARHVRAAFHRCVLGGPAELPPELPVGFAARPAHDVDPEP